MAVESCQRGFYSDSDDNTMTTTGRREEAHTPNKKEKITDIERMTPLGFIKYTNTEK